MTRFEIRNAGALSVREDAESAEDAVSQAMDKGYVLAGDEISVEDADELPIGYYGDDAEAPAHEYGDHV